VSSLIVAAGERRSLIGVGFENMMRSWVMTRMRGPAWTGHGGVSMAGGREGQGATNAITAMICLEFAYVFRLSFSMRKVASEQPFCALIYMNSHI